MRPDMRQAPGQNLTKRVIQAPHSTDAGISVAYLLHRLTIGDESRVERASSKSQLSHCRIGDTYH